MNSHDERFDAVAMMRSIRDHLSEQIQGMTLEEELKWLESQKLNDPFLRRLREKATTQQAAVAGRAARHH